MKEYFAQNLNFAELGAKPHFFQKIHQIWGGGDPELGLRDLAAPRLQTFAIPSYPFERYNAVELRYAKLYYCIRCYAIRYDIIEHIVACSVAYHSVYRSIT